VCLLRDDKSLSQAGGLGPDLWAVLAPQDLRHERLEFLKCDFSGRGGLHLAEHGLDFIVSQVLALAAEALLKIGLRNETGVVNVEVMESESHVRLSDCPPAIHSHGKELSVVDFTIVVEVDALEDLIEFVFR